MNPAVAGGARAMTRDLTQPGYGFAYFCWHRLRYPFGLVGAKAAERERLHRRKYK
jgi:hypothetical protein